MRPNRFRFVLEAAFPGALAGTLAAGLIFFLNPHLPFAPWAVLRGVVFYSALLGSVSSLLALLVTRACRVPFGDHWIPVTLTLVLATAGIVAWIHASYFAFYLPPGINRRLLKAAIWLSLAAVACFYTTLLHRIQNRPYGHRSQVLFALLACASIYVVLERREAFRPTIKPSFRPTTFQGSQRPQLYVVGIESATLDAILPLEEQGHLPFFSRMLRDGSYSRLSTLKPTRRSTLWTTLATGQFPYRHGVLDDHVHKSPFLGGDNFFSLLPIGLGFEFWGTWGARRRTSTDRQAVLSVWEILSRLGVPTALVGWPHSTSSEELQVTLTDDFFASRENAALAHPSDLTERAKLFRPRAGEIDRSISSRFGSSPPEEALTSLASDLWRKDLSLFLLEDNPNIEALFVVLPGLEDMSKRFFGGYSAVQFKGPQNEVSEEAAEFISAYYSHLDDLLSQLWERSRDPRLLIVVSAYGAEGPSSLRELQHLLLRQPNLGGFLGSEGILMLLGEGIKPGPMQAGELVDVVPTLLYALGFPIARDLNGSVLTAAFNRTFLARQPLTFLPSYEVLAPSSPDIR